jgi:DNA-binding HxlR family transcriptional regulator
MLHVYAEIPPWVEYELTSLVDRARLLEAGLICT